MIAGGCGPLSSARGCPENIAVDFFPEFCNISVENGPAGIRLVFATPI